MIPHGDYGRYQYWEELHAKVDARATIEDYQAREQWSESLKDDFNVLPRLARKAGWARFESSVELGCGWGTYTLSLARAGMLGEIWLLDISVSALKGTRKVFESFGYLPFLIQGEIHDLPLKDRAFEVSLSGGLYEHFVGEEQRALVGENLRICRKLLCQVPEGSLAYWAYRKFFTWWWGNWPFGFEAPLKRRRLRELYVQRGSKILAWDYNNLVTALWGRLARRFAAFASFSLRPFFFYLFRHDVAVAVDATGRG
jgi:hypothetical protein